MICGLTDMMEWKIGDGSHTRFWKDKWCGRKRLQHKFARLFLNSEQKEECEEKMGQWREMVDGFKSLDGGEVGLSRRRNWWRSSLPWLIMLILEAMEKSIGFGP